MGRPMFERDAQRRRQSASDEIVTALNERRIVMAFERWSEPMRRHRVLRSA